MLKRIYSYIAIAFGSAAFLVACDDDDKITHFSTFFDVSKSSVSAHKYGIVAYFSTDGGKTFVDYPKVSVGQEYQVKIVDGTDDADITKATCFDIDWSASNPQPTSVAGGVATFVMTPVSDLSASVIDVPLDATIAAGTYTVVTDDWADYHAGDVLTVQKVDATHLKIVGYPATNTNHADLVLTVANGTIVATVPSQASGAYGTDVTTTKGSGTASSCTGYISLTLDFVVSGDTYADNHLVLKKK